MSASAPARIPGVVIEAEGCAAWASESADCDGAELTLRIGGAGMRRLVLQARQVYVTACLWLPDATEIYESLEVRWADEVVLLIRTVAVEPGSSTVSHCLHNVRFSVGSLQYNESVRFTEKKRTHTF